MAFSDTAVLITGESGTGKELFAHSIHNSSNRSAHPFVAINCAAIPDTLLESELFGYEEGAFSGAKRGGKAGLFEIADKGTIFLDEINSMSTAMQIKLLRVMQEKEFMRVGGNTLIPIDVRIISATNQDLLSCVAEGQFRQDLYYRVSTLPIRIPPLRERGDDVFELIDAFCVELHCSFKLSDDAKKAIAAYTWPGNIRELRNCVEYLKCLNLDYIAAEHLPSYIHSALTAHSSQPTEQEIYTAIAALLAQKKCGRKTIMIALSGHGWQFSEAHIRQIMHQMKENGWISTNGGRSGSFLTQKGIRELISNQ
jgi:transcriptional regulator with PAS, ATPase and Fis domain